jgi:integrase
LAKKKGNGEGSITRHKKSGLYMARYTVQTPAGPKRKTIYGKTRRKVDEKLTAAKSDRDKGLRFDAENQTLGEYLDSWLKGSVRGSVRQSTFDRYEIAVRVHIKPALGKLKLKKLITPAHIQSFYQDKLDEQFAPASVSKLHVVLHKALSQAVQWHMIPRNVADVVKASETSCGRDENAHGVTDTPPPRSSARGEARSAIRAGRDYRDAAGRVAGPQMAGR